jgi:hypothetical protein
MGALPSLLGVLVVETGGVGAVGLEGFGGAEDLAATGVFEERART